VRTLHDPSPALRRVQKRIQTWLDDYPLDDAVHGWRRGRSIRTNAAVHVGKPCVVALDIERFFPSTPHTRVRQLFEELGCGAEVARILTKLVTADGYLAQGFLTSPVLGNVLLSSLHRRITHLCAVYGVACSFYGDDLTISGGPAVETVLPKARVIVEQEGYRVSEEKMLKKGLQTQEGEQVVCGVVVNTRLTAPAAYIRETRRLLQECLSKGCADVARRTGKGLALQAHLRGRVQFIDFLDARAARSLRYLYRKIDWPVPNPLYSPVPTTPSPASHAKGRSGRLDA